MDMRNKLIMLWKFKYTICSSITWGCCEIGNETNLFKYTICSSIT